MWKGYFYPVHPLKQFLGRRGRAAIFWPSITRGDRRHVVLFKVPKTTPLYASDGCSDSRPHLVAQLSISWLHTCRVTSSSGRNDTATFPLWLARAVWCIPSTSMMRIWPRGQASSSPALVDGGLKSKAALPSLPDCGLM